MQIEIKIEEKYKEPKIIVMTDKMTDEVNAIIKKDCQTSNRRLLPDSGRIWSRFWNRLRSTVFLPNQVRCLPRQITASMRSV